LKAESFSDEAFKRALFRLGLERLAPLLDTTHRWDRELSQDEQLCLAFARILLQAPPWVLIDGTLGTLDDDVLELVVDVFAKELLHTGVIHIGGPAQAHPLFSRVLHLVKAVRVDAAKADAVTDALEPDATAHDENERGTSALERAARDKAKRGARS